MVIGDEMGEGIRGLRVCGEGRRVGGRIKLVSRLLLLLLLLLGTRVLASLARSTGLLTAWERQARGRRPAQVRAGGRGCRRPRCGWRA